ncbi:hypothetical protein BDW74DRAFT_73658 [Aspergillus multicolor]|uniref:uncharacterized protein n=1 Tax=Aspergillus multicolor TaxID=41759 RepID=UPI003CCD2730
MARFRIVVIKVFVFSFNFVMSTCWARSRGKTNAPKLKISRIYNDSTHISSAISRSFFLFFGLILPKLVLPVSAAELGTKLDGVQRLGLSDPPISRLLISNQSL